MGYISLWKQLHPVMPYNRNTISIPAKDKFMILRGVVCLTQYLIDYISLK